MKIRWAYPSVLFVILFFFVSCHQNAQPNANIEMKEVMLAEPPQEQPGPPPPSATLRYVPPVVTESETARDEEAPPQKIEVTERKIIKTGDVRFKTHDLQKTRQTVVNAVNTVQRLCE